ncbi:hypothetical protein WP50_11500 [Lactiplantibacillus plantarum]|nr:hypothetical protein WP50_11500 [Lactiplantibacillus plantarum]
MTLAEGYVKSGHTVTLFQRGPHLINEYLDPQISEKIEDLLTTKGIQVRTNAQVTAFSPRILVVAMSRSEVTCELIAAKDSGRRQPSGVSCLISSSYP